MPPFITVSWDCTALNGIGVPGPVTLLKIEGVWWNTPLVWELVPRVGILDWLEKNPEFPKEGNELDEILGENVFTELNISPRDALLKNELDAVVEKAEEKKEFPTPTVVDAKELVKELLFPEPELNIPRDTGNANGAEIWLWPKRDCEEFGTLVLVLAPNIKINFEILAKTKYEIICI